MGVLECDREGCDNIMCDRFSWQLQKYICRDCFRELIEFLKRSNVVNLQTIESFMALPKNNSIGPNMAEVIEKFAEETFPIEEERKRRGET